MVGASVGVSIDFKYPDIAYFVSRNHIKPVFTTVMVICTPSMSSGLRFVPDSSV